VVTGAAVVFLVWRSLAGLLVARVLTGLAVGAAVATATAFIADLGAAPGGAATPWACRCRWSGLLSHPVASEWLARVRGTPHRMDRARVLRVFSAYYVVTGVWPFVHLRSFLAVTGPKSEIWMLRTLSALITAVGVALGRAAAESATPASAETLAVGSAAALGAIDVWYVVRRRISPVYLFDAAAQVALLRAFRRA
jgi:hypothetical protein